MGDDIPDYEVMQRVGLPCCRLMPHPKSGHSKYIYLSKERRLGRDLIEQY